MRIHNNAHEHSHRKHVSFQATTRGVVCQAVASGHTSVHTFCSRLLFTPSANTSSSHLPKVSYAPNPEARLFGDADEWAQFFGEGDAYLNAVRAAAPLRICHHVFAFRHKSLQEFNVASEVRRDTAYSQ